MPIKARYRSVLMLPLLLIFVFSACDKCFDCTGCSDAAYDDTYCYSQASDYGITRSEVNWLVDDLEATYSCDCQKRKN